MKKRNPIECSQYINDRYKEYLRSSFKFGNDSLQRLFEQELEEEALFKGPYVALTLPFLRGKSIEELIAEGVLCRSFRELGDIDFLRPLYSHQVESIKLINGGRNAIITTGTGSGKTECFLYPILNDLLKEQENGIDGIGIRAIFLYPMNALVNDQIERVRKILDGYSKITFGFFTGETKETVAANYREKYEDETGIHIPENELVSREEIRKNPPHILFTNYSMLEYLMIRPNDYAIFSPDRLQFWKYVVLDEAHSYSGSLGIELSMLMRRLTGLTDHKPNFILTSATLGKQGKSEEEIINFARGLTSGDYEKEDIIFSKRIQLTGACLYSVAGKDYLALKDHISNELLSAEMCKSYQVSPGSDAASSIYELLSADVHTHQLYNILKESAKDFRSILNEMSDLNSEELIALIDLINAAEKKGIGLFDLKYHSFVRPLSGAYITLGDTQTLSLTKTNTLSGLKAFEVGNCRYCNAPYIIGRIQYDDHDQLDYLFQNKEVDIYENYGNNEFVGIDYFLMENTINEEEVDESVLDEYTLCAKCGNIYETANLNARRCSCGESFKHVVYKVNQKRSRDMEEAFNNINQCPCCGHSGRTGIVKSLNVGKDEGTALIAQTLYEAIDEETDTEKKPGKLSLKLNKNQKKTDTDRKVKQFISFSDSRQQASFAAVFLDANHVRLLRKRLIWQVIEDHDYRTFTVDELAAYLTTLIKGRQLFQNDMTAHKNAWVAVMVDLLKVDGVYDGEGLGLYYFDLDLSEIMEQIDEADVKEAFGQYNITKHDLEAIMQVVLGVFKTAPAISYEKSTLTPEERLEYLEFRRFNNHVVFNAPKGNAGIRSFLPVKGKDNMIVRYIQKVCSCDESNAKEILDVIFNNLAVDGELLKKDGIKDEYQIDVSRYVVKNYRHNKFFRCSKCGRLTPYNVHNMCVQDRCDGVLSEVDPDVALATNFYRNQYKNKKIERIVIKEHTAQLDRKTAREYQRAFKNKEINILSCSTTFEMGVDIGSLETVFMRNVPPTPANYVQRAGRAGRRRDSSAYVLTYCGTGSHDYTYFSQPEKMISGVIRPPYFDVLNHKIITRHLLACSLGFFFRKKPQYFKSVDELVFRGGISEFKAYMESHPEELNQYISKYVLPESRYEEYHDFKWYDPDNTDEKLEAFIETIVEMDKEYNAAKTEALNEEEYKEADLYMHLVNNLHKARVLEMLSRYCVIPKYGFPVDVVDLQIYNSGVPDNRYDLSRDLKIAISEYAPDSEVIVDGKKYTSKYISLPKASHLPRRYFCTCSRCRKVNVFLSSGKEKECKYCGEAIGLERSEFYIEPVNGFKTGITKESIHMKPKRSYAGEVSYLGGGVKDENHLILGNQIFVETSGNDELLVMNRSRFYMCPLCGYSDIAKRNSSAPIREVEHNNHRQYKCENDTLEEVRIGHSFKTDVARFTIPMLQSIDGASYAQALSFMYAFLEGISNALDIERNDINGILELNLEKGSYDVLVYDNVPGGAGHVKRLLNKDAVIESLRASLEKTSQNCCDENTSCYNCLRNYYNQLHHSKLRRIYAIEVLETLLQGI